jgi:hypothetical protein
MGAFRTGPPARIGRSTPNLSAMRNIAMVGTAHDIARTTGGTVNGAMPTSGRAPRSTAPAGIVSRRKG